MTERAPHCPTCSQAGTPADRITLKALLTPDGLRRGVPAQPSYCPTAECPTVYFDVDGGATFTEADLTVRVYAKHPGDPEMPVCYCFNVNVGSMCAGRARELREMVAHEVQAHHCACEVKNPKGGCCLGDLVRIERGYEHADPHSSCCAVS